MTTPTSSTAPSTPSSAATSRGRFAWYDLMTTDVEGAKAFYAKVANWGTQDWNSGPEPYTMWTANGAPIGGVAKITPEMGPVPPHWMAHVTVPNCDAAAKQAESLGGKVVTPPMDIPEVGRFAVITDPQGAPISLFAPSGPPMPARKPNIGEFSWHELATSDMPAAFTFYATLFGWTKSADHDMGPMGTYRIFGREGMDLGGMFNKPAEMPMPPNWCYYIRVESADAAAERVKANGGQVLNGPMDVPGGDRIAQCLDPQGAYFAVHSTSQG